MRDNTLAAQSEEDLDRNLKYNLSGLKRLFGEFKSTFSIIPPSSSIEIQHICMHCAGISVSPLEHLKKSHYRAALGHGRRAYLDACKEFIFSWKKEKGLTEKEQFQLSRLRLKELQAGLEMEFSHLEKEYRYCIDRLLYSDPSLLKQVKNNALSFDESYWTVILQWLELDLLLSSLSPDRAKQKDFLQRLIQSFLFDERELKIPSRDYLADTVEMQKFMVFKYLTTDTALIPETRKYLKQIDKLDDFVHYLKNLPPLKNNPNFTLAEVRAINSHIFPIIRKKYNLRYF